MHVDAIDHLVLTVTDIEATCTFYTRVLGMRPVTFGEGRRALAFGKQKINLHPADRPLTPHAALPTPGSADLCLITSVPITDVITHLESYGIPLIEGPVRRTGAQGPLLSVYIRDPDRNLVEISNLTEHPE